MKAQKSNQYPPYHAYSSCNIVTSAKPTATNPSRCWMNIEVEKLESFANEDMWIFDTNVQNVRRVYYIEISTLKAAFEQRYLTKMTKGTVRYSFYMDYAEGILYTAAPSTTGEYILTLKNLPDGETYRNFMRRLPK